MYQCRPARTGLDSIDSVSRNGYAQLNEESPTTRPSDCWNQIGVWGDRTCPELEKVAHCRNCPVYSSAGRQLLDRGAPGGYLVDWTRVLAREKKVERRAQETVVLFRVGDEWFGIPTRLCAEIVEDRTVHWLPHRSDSTFTGLVSVQGEIYKCISLSDFLELEPQTDEAALVTHIAYKRMIVLQEAGDRWVVPVDEVFGVYDFSFDDVHEPPVTLSKARRAFTKGLIEWHGGRAGWLDGELLLAGLQEQVT